ncbi:MAG: HAD-IIA family hydrolase [Anaerolineae bacterium]|nr:HAD-IIA family hydrolase [Anaerolineae bacterium]
MKREKVAAIILAAGASTRLGQPKQCLDWDGYPMIVHVADTAWSAGLVPVVVVLGANADQIVPALQGRPVQIIHNYRWREGMSASLNAGLSALPPDVDAALFMPVDQPLITPQILHELVQRWQTTSAGIVATASAEGQRGTPALFDREFFPELATLSGEMGGRALFERHPDRLAVVHVDGAAILSDIDTPDQLNRLREHSQRAAQLPAIAGVRGIICDMDGVLWRDKQPLPGLHEFFNLISELGLGYVLATNNSSRTPAMYVEKLANLGVQTTSDHILTSATATGDYLAGHAERGARVYVLGSAGVREALQAHGFNLTEGPPADYVVVGWDQNLTWKRLATATRLILSGARFIGTNPDRTFPLEEGVAPGNGAQLAALETATGIAPLVVGKPFPILYQQALARMEIGAEEALVIGDRLDTDILGGLRLGMPTALVLSGVTQSADLKTTPIRPDMVFDDLSVLTATWRKP